MERTAAAVLAGRTQGVSREIRALGPFEVDLDDVPLDLGGPKQRGVLALIVVAGPTGVSVDTLVDQLWGEGAPEAARSSVYSYISNLRGVLAGGITRSGSRYVLDLDHRSDFRTFEGDVGRARDMLATNPIGTHRLLTEALGTWRGPPFAGLPDSPMLHAEALRLEELRLEAVELRIEAELAMGRAGSLVGELEVLTREYPLRERFRAQHMIALYRSGRQAEALRGFQKTREHLLEELGVDPSEELRDLELRILQQDPELLHTAGRLTTQRAALLFTDIVGSTRLWDANQRAMADALAAHDALVHEAVAEEGGSIFKHTGDGAMCVFPGISAAVRAAETAQRSLQAHDWGGLPAFPVRMALDFGDVDVRDGDFFGPPLNRCARLAALGHGGQVLLSASAASQLAAEHIPGVQIRQLGEFRLRGLAQPEHVAELVFVGLSGDFPPLREDLVSRGRRADDYLGWLPGFELRERLGAGRYSTVYRAYQPSVGREVAVKVIGPEYAGHPEFIRQFDVEARRVARLEHPHIVPIHDFWRDPDGAYFVMRLLRGGSLRSAIRMGPTDPGVVSTIFGSIGSALGYAHTEGVPHMDLVPENVLLDGAGGAYVSDFAITASLLRPLRQASVTHPAPAYLAPEVRFGDAVDHRSDVYSLGVLAFELLTGAEAPSTGPIPAPSSCLPTLPAGIDQAVARATSFDPSDRFVSAAEFSGVLIGALGVGSEPEIRSSTPTRNPYKGLRPFTEADSADFHGRTALVETIVDAVAAHHFVTVVGPSGSGKSSAVAAGFLPWLRVGAITGSEEWMVAKLTPGATPVENLVKALESVAVAPIPGAVDRLLTSPGVIHELVDEALPEGPDTVLFVIDQFEELFTDVAGDEGSAFEEVLAAAVDRPGRIRILTALRADFYDRPLLSPTLADHVRRGQVTVVPPSLEELVECIEQPAHLVGLTLEPGLSMRIAHDVAGQPGGLPLLQFALTEMVERRTVGMLTSVDYEQIGGVSGAVATRAETVHGSLDADGRECARRVFLQLVSVGEDSEPVRRRIGTRELTRLGVPDAVLDGVLSVFEKNRLLSFDRNPATRSPTVEVSHESLLAEWDRLSGWIDDHRESLVMGRRLRDTLVEWEHSGRSNAYLLAGARLAPFVAWSDEGNPSDDEREFIARSRLVDDARTARSRLVRRTVTAVLAVVATIAAAFAVYAGVQRAAARDEADRAEAQQHLAEEQAAIADEQTALAEEQTRLAEQRASEAKAAESLAKARELAAAAISVGDEDPQLAMLLALEAFDVAPADAEVPIELAFSLREAMYSNRLLDVVDLPGAGSIRVSPEGRFFFVLTSTPEDAEQDEDLVLFDLETIEEVGRVEDVSTLAGLSPDGASMLLLLEDSLEVRSVPDTALIHSASLECSPGQWSLADWSPDGSVVAYMGNGCGAVVLLETETWTEVHRIPLDLNVLMDVFFAQDPDANRLLINLWRAERTALVFDTQTFEEIAAFDTPIGNISPDGSTYFGMEYGETPQLFDVESGEAFDNLAGMGVSPSTFGARFSPDGRYVLMPTEGSITPIWDVTTGEIAFRIPAGQRAEAAFTGDGRLLTSAWDDRVRIWDLTAASAGERHTVDTGSVFGMRSMFASETVGTAHSLDSYAGTASALQFDPKTGELTGESRPIPERLFTWTGALGDLGVVFGDIRESDGIGQVVVWDGRTGEERVLLDCAVDTTGCLDGMVDHRGMWSSVDGSEFGMLTMDRVFLAWGSDGEALLPVPLDYEEGGPTEMLMSFSSEWIVVRNDWSYYNVFDREGNLIAEFDAFDHLWLRFDRTGAFAIGWGFSPGPVSVIDPSDWSVEPFTDDLGGGLVRDATFSPSGELVSLGIQGGPQRIFTFPDGELVARIPFDSVVSSYWVDDEHIAVATRDGLWTVITLDTGELREMADGQLKRGFTADECRTYRIDSCAVGPSDE